MSKTTTLYLPPHLQKKQMIPKEVVLEAMNKLVRQERRGALVLFRKLIEDPTTTKAQIIDQIDELLNENDS